MFRAKKFFLMLLVLMGVGSAYCVAFGASENHDKILSLEEYLQQVASGHKGVRAAKEASQGAWLRASEGSLSLYPALFASGYFRDDKRPTTSTTIQGNETISKNYSFGVSQLTPFGLQAKLVYTLMQTDLFGINQTLVPTSNFFDASPQLELTQSLWRNGFGRETRSQQEFSDAQASATSFAERFKTKLLLADAESAYWRLTVARDIVNIQRQSLERAQKIYDWTVKREHLQLGDKADRLQAEAALKGRELELKVALNEERAAIRTFNSLRGLESEELNEVLPFPHVDMILTLAPVSKAQLRDDVQAAQEAKRATQANADMALERNSPTLELFSTLSLNGRDQQLSEAASQSFMTGHPLYLVGVRFSTPLGLGALSDTREGYRKDRFAAELNFERKLFEQEREWEDLSRQFLDAKESLKLTQQIEAAQKEKLGYERDRLSRGRTTTYQLLLFEQDYANAQVSRIRSQAAVLRILAQMKIFGGDES